MKKYILTIAVFFAITSSCTKSNSEQAPIQENNTTLDLMIEKASSEVPSLMPKDFMAFMEEGEPFILIDVRTESEHNASYIPGSINIPRGALEFRIENESVWENEGMYPPIKEDLIIVYCKKGHRGVLAASTLKALGFTNVKNISGGMLEWIQNFPEMVEKNETAGASLPAAGGGGGC